MNKRDENRARKLIYLMKSPNRKSENEQKNEKKMYYKQNKLRFGLVVEYLQCQW